MSGLRFQAAEIELRRYWLVQGGWKETVPTPAALQVALKLGPWRNVYVVPEPAPERRVVWNEFWRAG